MNVISYLKQVNRGSAVAEFLIFTLPFFTIFLVLITTVQSRSMAVAESKNLARQVIRAYVTSPNEELASTRAYQVIAQVFTSKISWVSRVFFINDSPSIYIFNNVSISFCAI